MSLYESLFAVVLVVFVLAPAFASLMGGSFRYEDERNHEKEGGE